MRASKTLDLELSFAHDPPPPPFENHGSPSPRITRITQNSKIHSPNSTNITPKKWLSTRLHQESTIKYYLSACKIKLTFQLLFSNVY